MVDKYPDELASLKNKRVISIGRIVEGKRVDEIVEIACEFRDWEFIILWL